MDDFFKLIANFGFPMVVAAYVLVRLEGSIRELDQSVRLLVTHLIQLESQVGSQMKKMQIPNNN